MAALAGLRALEPHARPLRAGAKGAAAAPVEALAFTIFSDATASAVGVVSETEREAEASTETERTEVASEPGEVMEEAMESPMEKEEAEDKVTALPEPGTAGMSARDLANLSMMDEEDGTINTRLAMGTIDAMFCDSPPPPQRPAAQKEESPSKASVGFAIFSDN